MSETNTGQTTVPDPGSAVVPDSSQGAPPAEGEGASTQGTEPSPQPTPEPAPSATPDWRDRRIATLTRRLREMQESQPRPTAPPVPSQQPDVTQLSNQQIEARARELSAIQDFNRRCDETALAGRAAFGEVEFNGRINNLQKLVDHSDPASVQAYNSLLIAAIDTGEGPKVLHALGADLNEAQRILALAPTKMAVELTRRALAPQPEVSAAPKPITPVRGNGGSHSAITPDDADRADHLSTSEWMRRREAQVRERAQNR
jgi:hypothetical protein